MLRESIFSWRGFQDSQVILKYQNEPFVTIPEYLIHKGADGQKYLQMRASSLPIVQFLTGAKNLSRASLTFYEPFQKLVEKRNEQLDRHHAMGGQEDQGDGDNLFEDQDRPKASRRKIQNLPETVNIYVGNTTGFQHSLRHRGPYSGQCCCFASPHGVRAQEEEGQEEPLACRPLQLRPLGFQKKRQCEFVPHAHESKREDLCTLQVSPFYVGFGPRLPSCGFATLACTTRHGRSATQGCPGSGVPQPSQLQG